MKILSVLLLAVFLINIHTLAADKADGKEDQNKSLRQWYSGKLGYYQPRDGLNNGLVLGVDGITEFTKYNIFLSGALDAYIKQSIDIFQETKPQINSQQIILLPLHINFGYKLFDIEDADCRGYIGVGGGYYFFFYSLEYQTQNGIIPTSSSQTESKNSGNLFGTAFARVILGKMFVEPRLYFASKTEGNIASYKFTVNPSGFAISIGFQQ